MSDSRAKLALLGFFPAFDPPKSGGEMRAYHTWRALAERYDVAAVTPTFPDAEAETVRHAPALVERRIPKKAPHVRWHQRLGRLGPLGRFPECSAFVVGLAGGRDAEFAEAAHAAIDAAEVVVFEGPFFPAFQARPGQTVVYSSYNVEYRLQAQTWGGPLGAAGARLVRRWERRLVQRADVVFACSEEDAAHFVDRLEARPESVFVAPNGTELERLPEPAADEAERTRAWRRLLDSLDSTQLNGAKGRADRPRAIFLGSSFPTNLEAARLIERELAPAVPEADFYLAGSCCEALDREDAARPPANVYRLGFLDEGAPKADFLKMAHIGLNPVLSGSGTSVKNLDFLGAGVPLLATPMGARGMQAFRGEGVFVEEPGRLAPRLRSLLGGRPALARAGRTARKVVENEYQWGGGCGGIGAQMVEAIEHVRASKDTARRVLVAVDYPIHPPDHGGKVRAFQQARALAAAGFRTTILSLNKDGRRMSRVLAPGIVETTVARTPAHNDYDREIVERMRGSVAFDDATCLMRPALLAPYRAALRRLAGSHGASILSHPYLAALMPELHAAGFVVHDAHNVEAEMKRLLLDGMKTFDGAPPPAELKSEILSAVAEGERRAVAESDLVLATSAEDLESLRAHGAAGRRLAVAPNGVDCAAVRPPSSDERAAVRARAGIDPNLPVAVFIGSAHPPNSEAARYIVAELAPAAPRVLFLLIGSVCGVAEVTGGAALPRNVRLIGMAPEAMKRDLLALADFALNPVIVGSGTNLKTVEYMAAGLAILTTPTGARGTGLADGENAAVRDRGDWPTALDELLGAPERAASMGRAARLLAEERFDWPVAMNPLTSALSERLSREAPEAPGVTR